MREYTAADRQILDNLAADIAEGNERLKASTTAPEGGRLVGSPGGNWKQVQARTLLLVPPDELLTQYGTTWFRALPRFDAPTVQTAVSMLRGKHSAAYAARKVTRMSPTRASNVRYFNSSDLWLAGYTVYHTPSEHNKHHVSVYYGSPTTFEQGEAAMASWADPNRVTLDQLALTADEAL